MLILGLLILFNLGATVEAKNDALPKLKEIEFKLKNDPKEKYIVKGSVKDNLFSNNTELTILSNWGDTIISGIYHIETNRVPTIEGLLRFPKLRGPVCLYGSKLDEGSAFVYGKFNILNQANPMPLSAKLKTWDFLFFKPSEIMETGLQFEFSKNGRASFLMTAFNDTIYINFPESKDEKSLSRIAGILDRELFSFPAPYENNALKSNSSTDLNLLSLNQQYLKINTKRLLDFKDAELVYNNGTILRCPEIAIDNTRMEITAHGLGEIIWPNGDYVILNFDDYPATSSLNVNGYNSILSRSIDNNTKWVTADGTYISGNDWLKKPEWVNNDSEKSIRWDKTNQISGSWTEVYQEIQKIYDEHNDELAENRRKEQEKEALKKERYNKLVSQYGARFAQSILDKRVEIGMTKQMVSEFLPANFYVITKSGNSEYWRYNEDKAQRATLAEGGGELLMILKLFGGSIKSTSRMSGIIGGPAIPDRITFTNGKVTSITD